MNQAAAGWYPDPEHFGHLRYWDGVRWTDHRAPAQSSPYAAPTAHPAAAANPANTLSILGIVFGGIAFLLFPVLFGPAGLILGAVGLTKGEKLAPVALAVAGAGLVVGIVLGAILAL